MFVIPVKTGIRLYFMFVIPAKAGIQLYFLFVIPVKTGIQGFVQKSIRAVNSAGECYLHTVEVAGSNPAPPTKQNQIVMVI